MRENETRVWLKHDLKLKAYDRLIGSRPAGGGAYSPQVGSKWNADNQAHLWFLLHGLAPLGLQCLWFDHRPTKWLKAWSDFAKVQQDLDLRNLGTTAAWLATHLLGFVSFGEALRRHRHDFMRDLVRFWMTVLRRMLAFLNSTLFAAFQVDRQ